MAEKMTSIPAYEKDGIKFRELQRRLIGKRVQKISQADLFEEILEAYLKK